jgi:hypothetical protein
LWLFRNCRLTDKLVSSQLIMNALRDADTEFSKMKKIELVMRELRIEDTFFNVRIYADQQQFRIKDHEALIERLMDREKLQKYHEEPRDEKKEKLEPKLVTEHIKDPTARFEEAFNRYYTIEHNMNQYVISNILGQDEYTELSCKNLVYEIMHQSKVGMGGIMMFYMMMALFTATLPLLYDYLTDGSLLITDNDKLSMYLSVFPNFVFYMMNLVLFGALGMLFEEKMNANRIILTMLDNKRRQTVVDLRSEMP